MLSIQSLDTTTALDAPRRVMKYLLIYCKAGALTMAVDEKQLTLGQGDVLTITSGQIHYITGRHQAQGYILEFTLDFFCKDDKDVELIFHNGLFCHFAMNEVIAVDPSLVEEQLTCIKEELTTQPYQYLISVHSRITLILVAINRAKIGRGDEIWKPNALFLKFLEAVRENFAQRYSVADFARQLDTTELKLNELAKQHAGKTAQNVIFGLVVSEAKRRLTYGDSSIKEVAHQLGFDDPFYFSNFFKKQTRLSPKQYKAQYAL